MISPIPFTFGEETASSDDAVCAAIPAGIMSKTVLLTSIAAQLKFPEYFGNNWDALEQCIRDLSWLPSGRVVAKHADIPLVGDPKEASVYASILADAVIKMSRSKDHPLAVVFPSELPEQI